MRTDDIAIISAEERIRAIATLLACGVRRLLARDISGTRSAPEKPRESLQNCLEVEPESRLSVHTS